MRSGIIYRGPSEIDGQPIVAIAIAKSRNTKTGDMVQTYILCDNGLDPMLNNKLGHDRAICGDCKFRGEAVEADARCARRTARELLRDSFGGAAGPIAGSDAVALASSHSCHAVVRADADGRCRSIGRECGAGSWSLVRAAADVIFPGV